MVTDWTHLAPPEQTRPDWMKALSSQPPVQPAAGSNAVCGVVGPSSAQLAAFAVTVVGSPHEPTGCAQLHAPQLAGPALRSACPSKPTAGAMLGHSGTAGSGPIASSKGPHHSTGSFGMQTPSQRGYGPSALASPPSLLAKNPWQYPS